MTDTAAEFVFSTTDFTEVPVTLDNNQYVLREASAKAAKDYRKRTLESIKLNEEGKPVGSVGEGLFDAESFLVSLCLFGVGEKDGERTLVPVPKSEILKWPAAVVNKLFTKAREISDLGEPDSTVKGLKDQRDKLTEEIEKLETDHEQRKNS